MDERYISVDVGDWVRLCVQFVTGAVVIFLSFLMGILHGSLEPVVGITGLAGLVVLVQAWAYLLALLVVGMAVVWVAGPEWVSDETGRYGPVVSACRDSLTLPAVGATAVGAVVGAGLVFGVPAWLSTQLPLAALSVAAVAFALAGNAVPVRGLDTTLSTVAGTIFLFVVPSVLHPLLGDPTLYVAPAVAIPFLAVARGRLRARPPLDRRISVTLVVVLALAAVGTMAYDLSGPRPTPELDTDATVNLSAAENRSYAPGDVVTDRPMVRVGAVEIHNEFRFARTATLPAYRACLYAADGHRVSSDVEARAVEMDSWLEPVREIRLPGRSERRITVGVFLDSVEGRSLAQLREMRTVPVRRAERCPETTDGPALVLVPADEN